MRHWADMEARGRQAVGDALSGVLLVEGALRILGWTLSDWAATYTDIPSRQLKVTVSLLTPLTSDQVAT